MNLGNLSLKTSLNRRFVSIARDGLSFSVFTSNAVRFRNSSHKCERYALEAILARLIWLLRSKRDGLGFSFCYF
ncbi:hypothetical protein [Campylobacter vulpis]|uniref:Uncharacterized protein n=1 Tax=Campylobacter vulpis TaxID=1655500 RepID=A0A2G4R1K5_9BACT|nr:hypothetical protein [Campylobacter vulpis]MBS4240917.1 hypothetical protein [Campylobacter vulpis]MBS4281843.1 hypothetical protein [Campylobacter vulpis]MBS4313654.1 hypothetical protein [Campylobacter vulpis]MBS4330307.1 hypothetical protein [Campylobacter vulpis]MBS4331357.1 hypothetical protein [Campylobacter vulpis]